MMPKHEIKGEGWKKHIITNPSEDQEDFNEESFARKSETKSKIVNFVGMRKPKLRNEIVRQVNESDYLVEKMLDELREEDVLEVESRE